MELHWLPVEQRIEYKILLYTHKVVRGVAPDYLKELLESDRPGRNLRSANKLLIKTQSYQLKTYGYRAFSVCAPNRWNSLPLDLRLLENVEGFKKALKLSYLKEHIFNIGEFYLTYICILWHEGANMFFRFLEIFSDII